MKLLATVAQSWDTMALQLKEIINTSLYSFCGEKVYNMKTIKTQFCSSLSDCSLSHPVRNAMEAPDVLSEIDLDEIVDRHMAEKVKRNFSLTFLSLVSWYNKC